jgi:23S rRNA pseudouridine1911/1915/1917 synthase
VDDLPEQLDFSRAEREEFAVPAEEAGGRLDRFLQERLSGFSRASIQRLIRGGAAKLNGTIARPAAKVRAGDRVTVDVPEILPPQAAPEDLPLAVLREEDAFVVLDKAAGMAVHPGRGRLTGTLANAIAFRWGLRDVGGVAYRPGIVHRLDLETSGAIVVAKTEAAHAALAAAFAERRVAKEYRALVFDDPPFDADDIDLPLGRDVTDPVRMAVRFDIGRAAQTRVEVVTRFGAAAHVLCRPRTGRTHQIRVHLLSRGHPILGDRIYARRRATPVPVERRMLHAHRLTFPHPATGAPVAVEAPLPPDFRAALDSLALTR